MNPAAYRHLVERAALVHGDRFGEWFPRSFDWEDLCSDVPAMAARVGRADGTEASDERLADLAEAVFRASYLASLAALAARAEAQEDPEAVVDRLARPLDEDEEEVFSRVVSADLHPLEEALAEDGAGDLSEEGEEALRLASLSWPPTSDLVGEAVSSAAEPGSAAASVLGGVSRVAAILGAIRWLAAARANEGWPEVPAEEGAGDGIGSGGREE